ncbi:MAG: T9SS type A sorting domain-containing protein, partial [Candidatus Latescibacteria bacterium]|nr:T9SS type A sorting domain-containing protein [Candidatus Latescibacterota bacterium]
GQTGPVTEWSDRFSESTRTSWRAIPGQVALGSLPGNPTGSHLAQTGSNCESVGAGDLDGDGDVDLLTVLPIDSGLGRVFWFENAGDGETFTEHQIDDDFYGGEAVTAADLDGDGDLDIVASAFFDRDPNDDNGRYVWYENDLGDASVWTKHPIAGLFPGTEMVATADIDGDGDLDVYGASTGTYIGQVNDDIYWFENVDGDGESWTQHTIDADFPHAIDAVAGDFDGDGNLDIACVSYGSHEIAWWRNRNGDGTSWWQYEVTDFTGLDNSLDVGDLDDDGDLDIAATGFNAVEAGWFENLDGDGRDWAPHVAGNFTKGKDVEIADIDGDGVLDILLASGDLHDSVVGWFHNNGGGDSWAGFLVNQGHDDGKAAIATDIDGDGALDVVYTEGGSFNGDVAGLHGRDITFFWGNGELSSSVLDAGGPTDWTAIDWDASVPAETALAFQVRSSNDSGDLGPWSAEIASPGSLEGILDPDTRYAQVRMLLSTDDSDRSPRVFELSLETQDPASVDAGETLAALSLAPPRPNPAAGASRIALSLPRAGSARIDILDAGGRRVARPLDGSLAAGNHQVSLPSLSPGVYLVRLSSDFGQAMQKLVIR